MTYADECLEKLAKANPGPWQDEEFIAAAPMMVLELSKRLNGATQRLKEAAHFVYSNGRMTQDEYDEEIKYITTDLESNTGKPMEIHRVLELEVIIALLQDQVVTILKNEHENDINVSLTLYSRHVPSSLEEALEQIKKGWVS